MPRFRLCTPLLLPLAALAVLLTSDDAGGAHRAVPPPSVLMTLQTPAPTGRIVIKFAAGVGLTVGPSGLRARSPQGAPAVARLEALIGQIAPAARLERRFSLPAAVIDAERIAAQARSGRSLPDLNQYAQLIGAAPVTDRDALLNVVRKLAADPAVVTAFLEPVAVPAALGFDAFTGAVPRAAAFGAPIASTAAPAVTPDYTYLQGYLGSPPDGVNALAMSDTAGADGASVKVIDVEGAWLWSHEDLPAPFATLGGEIDALSWRNHGTAVLGVIRGVDNGLGVRGMAPACTVGASSIAEQWTADAINNAASALAPGDIILIELHAPGPNANGSGQYGYVPMEFWQDNYDAIMLATAAGVIVCEAAGNGEQDLDDPVYQGLFDRTVRDSGAIMCGASDGPSLEPAWFTNHGARVDLHGWGFQVTTCGYGNLQGEPGFPEPEWYTNTFNGTSSASPVVVGAVTSLQGMVKHAFGMPLDARLARDILSQSGTPQTGAQHIGPRPDLAAAWTLAATGIGEVTGQVTAAAGGAPLADVRVKVLQTGGFDLTGGTGGYRLALLVGAYDLVFSSFFYETATVPVTIASGLTRTEDVALAAKPTADIAGHVYGGIDLPLSGVRVTPLRLPIAGVVSAAGGDYEIVSVPVDTSYTLLYDGRPGYGAAVKSVSSLVPPGTRIPVSAVLPAVYEDFEDGPGDFSADSLWSYGAPAAGGPSGGFSGSFCWGVGMTGDYPDNATATLTSPAFNFGYTPIYHLWLSFHYWSETEAGFDGVQLEVFDGLDWDVREPMEDYTDLSLGGLGYGPGWSGSSGAWRGTVFDLSDLIGPAVQFRLVFGADAGVNGPGFWIDEIAFDDGGVMTAVAGDETPSAAGPSLIVFPNPFNPRTTIAWRRAPSGRLRLAIYDLRGRLVRSLLEEATPGGAGQLVWDGTDDAGRAVASGAYIARLNGSDGSRTSRRLSLVR
jgi:serine protease